MPQTESPLFEWEAQINSYLRHNDTIIMLCLDENQVITDHNDCFRELVDPAGTIMGKQLLEYVADDTLGLDSTESRASQYERSLNLQTRDHGLVPVDCCIFRKANGSTLILGGQKLFPQDHTLKVLSQITTEMVNLGRELGARNRELEAARDQIKVLGGIIPICMHCKEIRDDQGYWNKLESFISKNSEAEFSHGICDSCLDKHYPEVNG